MNVEKLPTETELTEDLQKKSKLAQEQRKQFSLGKARSQTGKIRADTEIARLRTEKLQLDVDLAQLKEAVVEAEQAEEEARERLRKYQLGET
jgi:hypothetical protein